MEINNLLDSKPDGYILSKGQVPNLLFRDEAVLAAYRGQITKILDAETRQQQERERFQRWESARAERLGGWLKN